MRPVLTVGYRDHYIVKPFFIAGLVTGTKENPSPLGVKWCVTYTKHDATDPADTGTNEWLTILTDNRDGVRTDYKLAGDFRDSFSHTVSQGLTDWDDLKVLYDRLKYKYAHASSADYDYVSSENNIRRLMRTMG